MDYKVLYTCVIFIVFVQIYIDHVINLKICTWLRGERPAGETLTLQGQLQGTMLAIVWDIYNLRVQIFPLPKQLCKTEEFLRISCKEVCLVWTRVSSSQICWDCCNRYLEQLLTTFPGDFYKEICSNFKSLLALAAWRGLCGVLGCGVWKKEENVTVMVIGHWLLLMIID